MDIATLILIAVVILVVATFIAKAVVLMPQGEAAVIERLGSYTRTISDGTGMIIPFIDRSTPGNGSSASHPKPSSPKTTSPWPLTLW